MSLCTCCVQELNIRISLCCFNKEILVTEAVCKYDVTALINQVKSSFFTSVGHPFPAVCIRTSTERPEALDKACFILSGIDEKGLLQAVDTAVEMNRNGHLGTPVPDYTDENVSDKVVKIIQSYTGVVDKMVWRKN